MGAPGNDKSGADTGSAHVYEWDAESSTYKLRSNPPLRRREQRSVRMVLGTLDQHPIAAITNPYHPTIPLKEGAPDRPHRTCLLRGRAGRQRRRIRRRRRRTTVATAATVRWVRCSIINSLLSCLLHSNSPVHLFVHAT